MKPLLYANLFEFKVILEGNRTTLRDKSVYIHVLKSLIYFQFKGHIFLNESFYKSQNSKECLLCSSMTLLIDEC